ncbi:MAG: hypothetical protein HDQ44_02145 [Desulfovibrio sp.]|nr:hypothetical protein [Desulfovibrio sp.]
MSQGLVLIDEAMELARREKAALEAGEYDDAIEMAEKRGEITGMAWNCLEHANHEPYRKKLLELMDFQKQLTDLAVRARNAVRDKMNRSKQEKRRIKGYSMAVSHALQ